MSGAGTLVLGPDIADMKRRPATSETVRLFNGPGNNGSAIRNGKTYNLRPIVHDERLLEANVSVVSLAPSRRARPSGAAGCTMNLVSFALRRPISLLMMVVKDRLGSISKQGDRYLRSLFTAGALAVIRYAKVHGTKHRPWLTAVVGRVRSPSQ
jgi:hypothetical protein